MKNLLLLIASITLFNCSTTTGPETAQENDTFTVYKTEYTWNNENYSFPIMLDTTDLHHYWLEVITHDFDVNTYHKQIIVNGSFPSGLDYITSPQDHDQDEYFQSKQIKIYLNMNHYWEDYRNGSETIVKLVLNQAYQY